MPLYYGEPHTGIFLSRNHFEYFVNQQMLAHEEARDEEGGASAYSFVVVGVMALRCNLFGSCGRGERGFWP